MTPYPHHYTVTTLAGGTGDVPLSAVGLPPLSTAPPAEFGGPGDAWSPETLFVGAVADCFVLTFRAVARAAGYSWQQLECKVEGTLDRSEGVTRFTHYRTDATLTVAPGDDHAKAEALLERAERACLIANSLNGTRELRATVVERAG
jgi:organic hydroperoxide reductase OsmC/OhrA